MDQTQTALLLGTPVRIEVAWHAELDRADRERKLGRYDAADAAHKRWEQLDAYLANGVRWVRGTSNARAYLPVTKPQSATG